MICFYDKKFLILLVLFLFSFNNSALIKVGLAETYYPGVDWQTSPLEDQNLDPALIEDAILYVRDNKKLITSMLIVRNGYLVEEDYFDKSTRNATNPIYSVTKSVMATLIGLAIQEGFIKSVNEKVLSYFPDYDFENANGTKQEMTIYHLLTMTSGLDWDEWWVSYSNPLNDFNALLSSTDWVKYILDKPMTAGLGKTMNYNTGASHILSAILSRAYGDSTEAFARKYLFEPLGIDKFSWRTDPQNITRGGEGLFLRALDMAKIGYLYLNNGSWAGNQVINSDWIVNATSTHVNFDISRSYGYQWWIDRNNEIKYYYAEGWAGQFIFIVPEKELIITFTSYDFTNPQKFILNRYIIPATEYIPPVTVTPTPVVVIVTEEANFIFMSLVSTLIIIPILLKLRTRDYQTF